MAQSPMASMIYPRSAFVKYIRWKRIIYRDFLEVPEAIKEPITLKRGLAGAKPEKVCWWAFELMGADQADELHDLYPGTGAVTRAWESWQQQFKEIAA